MKDEVFLTDDSENQRERERIEADWELGRKAYKGPRTRDIVDMFCDNGLTPEEALRHERQELAREFREAVEAAMKQMTFLCTDSCAGRVETLCTVLKETSKRFLIRVHEDCYLPGRNVKAGHEVYVPKYVVKGATPEQEPDITR